jgi:ribosomal protein L11 methyltransferase
MNNKYYQISWNVVFNSEESEILISFLNEIGFEAFHEDDTVFKAYIDTDVFDQDVLKETISMLPFGADLSEYIIEEMPDINWNSQWESNFSPVVIDNHVTVKAPFHKLETKTPHEIIIEPKMSFGTGHHETTSGMLSVMSELNFDGKTVIDMGCGTSILAVYASMLGAKHVLAIDIDHQCIINSLEIIELNKVANIHVMQGDIEALEGKEADIILANINRNILLNQIKTYRKVLNIGGLLMMSGFYEHDLGMIDEECQNSGFEQISNITNNNWIICLYKAI